MDVADYLYPAILASDRQRIWDFNVTYPIVCVTTSVEETLELGRTLGARLRPGDAVALSGELGAGKTVLTKGIATGLGIPAKSVVSPTFTIVNDYPGPTRVFHMDLFRLRNITELRAVDINEMLRDGVLIIEWADRADVDLPEERIEVTLEHLDESKRRLSFQATSERLIGVIDIFGKL